METLTQYPLYVALGAFQLLSPGSKVWIYQCDRNLEPEEINEIKSIVTHFAANWQSHGNLVRAEGDLLFGRFIVFAVDETQAAGASGCSIDESVKLIKRIEKEFSLNFFDRMQVCYLIGNEIGSFRFNELNEEIKKGTINTDTLIFNYNVSNLNELYRDWILPLKESWLKDHV